MTDIMKLATDYAQACYHLANPESYDAERAEEARAALQSAIEALRATQDRQSMQLSHDAVTIECLNDKVMALLAKNERLQYEVDAIASIKADRDQLQAENERLTQDRDEWRDSTIAANQNAASEEKRRREMQDQRDALQAKLDELGKGEPRFWYDEDMGELYSFGDNLPVDGLTPLYAAPKAPEPLTDAQCNGRNCSAFNGRSHSPECIADHNECVGGFGNKHPEFRYAGYKNAPLKAGASKEQIAAYEEGKKAAHGIGSQQ